MPPVRLEPANLHSTTEPLRSHSYIGPMYKRNDINVVANDHKANHVQHYKFIPVYKVKSGKFGRSAIFG